MSDSFIIILGSSVDGKKFRPSDWCDRLHGILNSFDSDEAVTYSNYVNLVNYDNKKAIMVSEDLAEVNSKLFNFYINFAKNNNLMTVNISNEERDTLYGRHS